MSAARPVMRVLLSTVIGARTGPAGTAGVLGTASGAGLGPAEGAAEDAGAPVTAGVCAAISSVRGEVNDQTPSTTSATTTVASVSWTARPVAARPRRPSAPD